MSSLSIIWLCICVTYSNHVHGITTKGSSFVFRNNSDKSQLLQIRSDVNETARNFLQAAKYWLSSLQQTHILDDVQKSQRIHYRPRSPANLNDRQKSLLGSQAQTSPHSLFDPSHLKYAHSLNNYNTLALPPLQKVALSPHQALPATLMHQEYLPYFKPISATGTQSNYTPSHKMNTLSETEPLTVSQEQPKQLHEFNPNHNAQHYRTTTSQYPYNGYPLYETNLDTNNIIKEIVIKTNPEELNAEDKQEFFQQVLGENNKSMEELQSSDDQNVVQNNLVVRTQFDRELMRQLIEKHLLNSTSNVISEFNLPDGQLIRISEDYNNNKNKAIVVKPHPITDRPSSYNLLDELTKGVVPPGVEVELIKRNEDGNLEEVVNLPPNLPQKKVTFVILEEQFDGTVKVQGVRGGENDMLQGSGQEVDSIIRKIQEGKLTLPKSVRPATEQSRKSVNKYNRVTLDEETEAKWKISASDDPRPVERNKQQDVKYFVPTPVTESITVPTPISTTSNTSLRFISSPSTYYEMDGTSPTSEYTLNHIDTETASWNYDNFARNSFADNLDTFNLNDSAYVSNVFAKLSEPRATSAPLPQVKFVQYPFSAIASANTAVQMVNVNKPPNDNAVHFPVTEPNRSISLNKSKHDVTYASKSNRWDVNVFKKTTNKTPINMPSKDNDEEESYEEETKTVDPVHTNTEANVSLSDILKKEAFFVMARFLRQSGLDSILNDTGPFTLFIPTDKAFRTLLIQLGGPDTAEEKFKDNPRLLTGLLLHHVIPGAFRVNTLQDEMIGVSLAGTQLRANIYTTHDIEWNDIRIVTVNGAKILEEKDIVIPQGIAHAIDRVMFPLPVGNLLQSLQSDRENRYSNFLKILEESELSYLLTGGKTFTLFAPLNKVFTHAEFTKIASNPNESKTLVWRHLIPGALYSAGMKYYQIRDSMEDGQQITLYKEAGKIKVNTAHVIIRNVPATNGVIHAIDALL